MLFRSTGGSADVGNREYLDKIVGGTVGWNQLAPTLDTFRAESGVTMTYADGVATISSTTARNGIYAPLSYRKGDKYLFKCDLKATSAYSVILGATSAAFVNKTVAGDNQWHTIVGIGNSSASFNANAYIFATTTYENLQVRNYNIIDLTALFNPTIADYIYSLEQSTAGAGVAWFRNYFPEDYYPYHAVSLESVQATAHKTYDGDGNVIGNYALDSSLVVRGVPKLVDGKLEFDGDVYPPSGEVQRRYGIVDLGTLDWYYGDNMFFAKLTNGNVTDAYLKNLICAKYPTTIADNYNAMGDKELIGARGYQQANVVTALIKDSAYTDAAIFKTAMSGVYLVYELATHTTETAEGYDHYQICDPSGTEEFVTDSIVPVGHETRYPHDLKKKVETAPDSPSTDGTYLMKRSGGKNTYMALPSTPSANGAYVLTLTVSGGNATYSWIKKE